LRDVSDSPSATIPRPPFVAQLLKGIVAGIVVSPIAMAPIDRFAPLALGASIAGAVFLAVWMQKKPLATCAAAVLIGALANSVAKGAYLERHHDVGFVLLPAFGIGFFAAWCICSARGGWRRAGMAGWFCASLAAALFINGQQLLVHVQNWNDQRLEASAQGALREMPTIDRVEIRASDGSPTATWSLGRTLTGSEAEELAAQWRSVGFHYDREHSGFDYQPSLHELRFYRDGKTVKRIKVNVGHSSFQFDAHHHRDCTFIIHWHVYNDPLILGELVPVDDVRAFAAAGAAFQCQHIDNNRAIELYEKAVALDPQNRHYPWNFGLFCREIGEQARAVEAFSRVIALDSTHTLGLALRADCYEKLGRPADAIADYSTLLNGNPGHLSAFYRRGVQYFEQGDFIRAIADFDSALSIGLNNADRARAKQLRSRAFTLYRQAAAPTVKAKPASPATTSSRSATGR
jgi:tetratricopeptide (TPR) repeat protein